MHTIHHSEQVYERLHPRRPGHLCPQTRSEHLFPLRLYTYINYMLMNSRGHTPSHMLDVNTHGSFFLVCLQLCGCCPTSLPFPISVFFESCIPPPPPAPPSASPLRKSSINEHREERVREGKRYGQVGGGREVEGWRGGQQMAVRAEIGQ